MTSESVLARIAEFLETIWTHPAAAAQFLESPDTALGAHNLSQSDLVGVDLPSVAGGLAGAGGLSPEGRQVLIDFASAPSVHHGGGGGDAVQHVAHVTRAVHHDNPTVQKVFVDNSQTFNIDNSTSFVNNGTIGGDVVFDNDANIATKGGVIVNDAGGDVAVGTTGAVVNTGEGDVIQAEDSAVLTGGSGGKDDDREGDDRKDDDKGQDDKGQDDVREDDDRKDDDKGQDDLADDDLSFGQGHSDGRQKDRHDDEKGQDGQHGRAGDEDQGDDGPDQQEDVKAHEAGDDPTAAAPDPTLVEGQEDQPDSATQPQLPGDEVGQEAHHDPSADDLVDV